MVKGNKQTTNDAASESHEIRALTDRLSGEVNARLDKFDQTILELKQKIESSKAQGEGGKGVESAMNAASAGDENPSTLRTKLNSRVDFPILVTFNLCSICELDVLLLLISTFKEEENMKRRRKLTLTATGRNEKRKKCLCVFCVKILPMEDEREGVVDVPTVDPVTTEEKKEDMANNILRHTKVVPSLLGIMGSDPIVLMGAGGTSHNFISM
ncbi:hypothetical protein HAX54_001536 [Datura stramonium]|uniref:Uncharacterized protein n=1 Tax=Datura stramonium TaxID=4076 RepID=A0ABS8RVY4_DATST|nr:hypothetical protein [Datura stramonium]